MSGWSGSQVRDELWSVLTTTNSSGDTRTFPARARPRNLERAFPCLSASRLAHAFPSRFKLKSVVTPSTTTSRRHVFREVAIWGAVFCTSSPLHSWILSCAECLSARRIKSWDVSVRHGMFDVPPISHRRHANPRRHLTSLTDVRACPTSLLHAADDPQCFCTTRGHMRTAQTAVGKCAVILRRMGRVRVRVKGLGILLKQRRAKIGNAG